MRIVFMGTPDFAVDTLNCLINSKHEVVAVFTQPDKPKGRSKKPAITPVKEAAQKAGIEVYQPAKVKEPEVIRQLKEINPDALPALLPYPPTPTSWPWCSSVLGHIKFARPRGLSSH